MNQDQIIDSSLFYYSNKLKEKPIINIIQFHQFDYPCLHENEIKLSHLMDKSSQD